MKLKLTLFSFLFAMGMIQTQAQTGAESFYIAQLRDQGFATDVMSNGNILICGITRPVSSNFDDILLMQVTSNGGLVWAKSYGTAGAEAAYDVKATSDGGCIIAGSSSGTSGGGKNALLIKVDANGGITWNKVFGNALADEFYAVAEISANGGYVASGYTYDPGNGGVKTDAYVVNVNNSGGIRWEQVIGGVGDDYGNAILVTSNGTEVIAGGSRTNGGTGKDLWLISLEISLGTTNWTKCLRGSGDEEVLDLIPDGSSGEMLGVGYTKSFTGGTRKEIILQNYTSTGLSNGNLILGSANYDLSGNGVVKNALGKYGVTGINTASGDAGFLLELDQTKTVTSMVFHQGKLMTDIAAQAGTGTFYASGSFTKPGGSDPAVYLHSLNVAGSVTSACLPASVTLTDTTRILNYYTPVDTVSQYGSTYTVTLTTSSLTITQKDACNPTANEAEARGISLEAWPNPSSGIFHFSSAGVSGELSIADMNGKIVAHQTVKEGERWIEIDLSQNVPGVYLAVFAGESGSGIQRIVKF